MKNIRRIVTIFVVCIVLILWAFSTAHASDGVAPSGAPGIGNCTLFPADNPWNRDVSRDPVAPNSSAIVNYINSGGNVLGFAFGSYLIYGIPYNVVPGSQSMVPVTITDHASQSDPGPYPIPADALIEGLGQVVSDQHLIVVDKDNCKLYEMYGAAKGGNGWSAKSGAVFDLKSNLLRPANWTSADAAGLPIFPGLLRYDEVSTGVINHALRFVVANNLSRASFVYPARHYEGSNQNASAPPMGTRVRLKASFDLSNYTGHSRVILEALKKYGMILADESKNSWTLWGTSSASWDRQNLEQLRQVPGSAFEVVDPQYSASAMAEASAVSMKVQYMPGSINTTDNQITPFFNIVNTSAGYGVLPEYTLRYWFTADANTSLQVSCTYAVVGCANINTKLVAMSRTTTSADYYIEVTFKALAGAVYPWGKSGSIQLRVTNGSGNFNENNDYSYSSLTAYMDWSRVTMYRNGALVWGSEPSNNTPTPIPATATRTPTRTPTKTPTTIPATVISATATTRPSNTPTRIVTNTSTPQTGGSLQLQYKNGSTAAGDNVIVPVFNLVNQSSAAIPYSELTIRYWFTRDSAVSMAQHCTYAAIDCLNIFGTTAPMLTTITGADYYYDVSFTSGAGSLAAGGQSGEIWLSLNKSDWTNFNETNDYSYDGTKTQFANWSKVAVYRKGVRIWGTEPTNLAPTATRTPTKAPTTQPSGNLQLQYKPGSAVGDNIIMPSFNLVNMTASAIPYSELTIRYWFTRDSGATISQHCDYAAIDCLNVKGVVNPMAQSLPATDYYYEVSFNSGAGMLAAGGQSGEIRMILNKSDMSNFNESNDFSYDGTKTQFGYWMKVAVYRNGVRIWGTEPTTATSTPTRTPAPTFAPPTNTPVK